MKEKWLKIYPSINVAKKYFIEEIKEEETVFEVYLHDILDQNNKVCFSYKSTFHAYRCTLNAYKKYILPSYHDEKFYNNWTFFKVGHSAYLEWLSDESEGISDALDFMHFCIVGSNLIVDIITTTYYPEIREI